MRRTSLFAIAVFVLAAALVANSAQAQTAPASAPAKTPDVRTVLRPALSPPLSPEQLAKQRLAQAAIPLQASARAALPAPGVKPEPAFTALPPIEGLALRTHDPAMPVLIARSVVSGAVDPKPPVLLTTMPPALEPAAAEALRQAHKLDHARAQASHHAAGKPSPRETHAPAPATLAPSQAAKQAQDASKRSR